MNMIFLVDGDNNIGTGLKGADQLTPDDSILVFYQRTGLALSKIKELCRGSRAKIQYLESVKGGKNSIDFQIITELGVLVGRGEADCAYVISQDKGYEAAMSALRVRYSGAFREVALRPSIASCLRASFLLRAATPIDLRTALRREFGEAQGAAAYQHLEELFRSAGTAGAHAAEPVAPVRNDAPAEAHAADRSAARGPESGAVKAADRPAGNGPARPAPEREIFPAAEPVLEQPVMQPAEPAPVQAEALAAPEDAAQPDGGEKPKTARTHRGGRRRKKPAEKAAEPTAEAEQSAEPVLNKPAVSGDAPESALEPASAAAEAPTAPENAAQPDGGEKPKTARTHRGGRRKKKPAEKAEEPAVGMEQPAEPELNKSAVSGDAPESALEPVPAPEPVSAAMEAPAAPEDAAQPDGEEKPKTARVRRGGRRKKKPAEKAEEPAVGMEQPAEPELNKSAMSGDAPESALEPVPAPEPAPVQVEAPTAPEETAQPDGGEKPKTARTRRGGRRKKKPAEKPEEEA